MLQQFLKVAKLQNLSTTEKNKLRKIALNPLINANLYLFSDKYIDRKKGKIIG